MAQCETNGILPFERRWREHCASGNAYSPRTGHAVVQYGGALYLFGGTDKSRRQQDLYKFDAVSREWTQLRATGDLPSRRSGAQGAAAEGCMYICGGYNGRDGSYFNDVFALDLKTLEWRRVRAVNASEGPAPRTDHTVVHYEGQLVVHGGYDGSRRFDDTFALDLKTLRWRQLCADVGLARPSRRFGHSAVVHCGRMIIFGGWDGRDTLNCTWSLDLRKESWRRESVQLAAEERHAIETRYRHAAAVHGDTMLVFGGVNKAHERFNDVCALNLTTFQWCRLHASLGTRPAARTFHRVAVVGDELLVLGGYDGAERLGDVLGVHVGTLSPPPLAMLAAKQLRASAAGLARRGVLASLPPLIVDGVLWARAPDGSLRGGRSAAATGELLCPRLELAHSDDGCGSAAADAMEVDEGANTVLGMVRARCRLCGALPGEHELVNEHEVLGSPLPPARSAERHSSCGWQPDAEEMQQQSSSSAPQLASQLKHQLSSALQRPWPPPTSPPARKSKRRAAEKDVENQRSQQQDESTTRPPPLQQQQQQQQRTSVFGALRFKSARWQSSTVIPKH